LERANMSRPKYEVPVELRNLAERTVEQAEKALDMSFKLLTGQWHRLLTQGQK
jgi:hypothetical protein